MNKNSTWELYVKEIYTIKIKNKKKCSGLSFTNKIIKYRAVSIQWYLQTAEHKNVVLSLKATT